MLRGEGNAGERGKKTTKYYSKQCMTQNITPSNA